MPLFAPGLSLPPYKGTLNRVHILTLHGWGAFNSAALETSEHFEAMARMQVRRVLDSHGMAGTTLASCALSGCGDLESGEPNRQTIAERVTCILGEMEALQVADQLRKADGVFVVAHSQGGVVAVHLIAHLLRNGVLQPNIPGVQHVGLLSLAGIHHGTHDLAASIATRDATRELAAMRGPTSPVFKSYLESLETLLVRGVMIVAVSSFNDRVVSTASALMDGIEHPNIVRAVFAHEKYMPSDGVHSVEGMSPLMALQVLVARMRNEGLPLDFARFITGASMSQQAWSALGEVGSLAGDSLMKVKRDSSSSTLLGMSLFGGGFLATAALGSVAVGTAMVKKYLDDPGRLSSTMQAIQDFNAHSYVHEATSAYRFGFIAFLARVPFFETHAVEDKATGQFSLRPSMKLPLFNVKVGDGDWETFRQSLDTIEAAGSEKLKMCYHSVLKLITAHPEDATDLDPQLLLELTERAGRIRRLL